MAIIAKDSGNGVLEPVPTGMQDAACCNVVDLGMQPGFQNQGMAHKVVLVFELAERKKEGEEAGLRFTMSKTYTLSLHEKAALRHDLESWRGRPFTAEELKGFDVEKVKSHACQLNIVEGVKTDGSKRFDVKAIVPPAKGTEHVTPERLGYVPKWCTDLLAAQKQAEPTAEPSFDDDIPF
jgi:hypothetical protein